MLERILADRRRSLTAAKRQRPLSMFIHHAIAAEPPRDFASALRRPDRIAVIAEIKFRSPSAGVLRNSGDVAAIAREFAAAGADALSVLTEPEYFGGRLEFIAEAKSACQLPILRKDFIFDSYQIFESRKAGADAVLLLATALTRDRIAEFTALATSLKMATLVELHDRSDLAKIDGLRLSIVGVNHRNLRTLELDHDATARLFPNLAPECTKVAESGISEGAQLRRMRERGAHAALIGTSLMREPFPGKALSNLIADACG